jgi:hypothetical protein
VGGLWATPQAGDGKSAIMYLYGGGYVISSPHSRRKTAGHLANASGARVLVPRYELAPEHPFPAAVDDAADDYRWLLGQGFRTERAVIAGDSSGGGLTIATMLKLRDDGTPLPAGGSRAATAVRSYRDSSGRVRGELAPRALGLSFYSGLHTLFGPSSSCPYSPECVEGEFCEVPDAGSCIDLAL